MRRLVALVILPVWLAGCETAPSSKAPACPREKVYSKEFLTRLADQFETLPAGSPVVTAMIDYGDLRAQARACRGK